MEAGVQLVDEKVVVRRNSQKFCEDFGLQPLPLQFPLRELSFRLLETEACQHSDHSAADITDRFPVLGSQEKTMLDALLYSESGDPLL